MARETLKAKALHLLLNSPEGLSAAELQRRSGMAKRYSAWNIRKLAADSGVSAVLRTRTGPDNRLRYWLEPSAGEAEVREAVETLAETPTTSETPGVAHDELMDAIIYIARQIRDRNHHA